MGGDAGDNATASVKHPVAPKSNRNKQQGLRQVTSAQGASDENIQFMYTGAISIVQLEGYRRFLSLWDC